MVRALALTPLTRVNQPSGAAMVWPLLLDTQYQFNHQISTAPRYALVRTTDATRPHQPVVRRTEPPQLTPPCRPAAPRATGSAHTLTRRCATADAPGPR